MQHNRKAAEISTGRWPSILSALGVDESFLKNRHGPCPICGGRDRFRFDDKQGRGTWYCNQCGGGDGFRMLELVNGWSFRESAIRVEQIAGSFSLDVPKTESDEAQKMAAIKRIWNETEPASKGDPVWVYLNRRAGIEIVPACVRFHPALHYTDGDANDYFPALVAVVAGKDGKGVGIHRIYLTESGQKAPVAKPKKLFAGKPLAGSAVRLGRESECLGIAEGIETALAASMQFGVVTWAAISSGFMEQWLPPAGISRVIVFGDNDESFTGQASAYLLAKRLKHAGLGAEVRIPEIVGKDWADMVSEG